MDLGEETPDSEIGDRPQPFAAPPAGPWLRKPSLPFFACHTRNGSPAMHQTILYAGFHAFLWLCGSRYVPKPRAWRTTRAWCFPCASQFKSKVRIKGIPTLLRPLPKSLPVSAIYSHPIRQTGC